MGVITGVNAAVDGISCLKSWRVQTANELEVAYCSASDAGPVVDTGNEDWIGVAVGYGHEPPVAPGSTFQFTGAFRGTGGSQKGVDSGASGAIVTKYVQHINVGAGQYHWYELHFASAASALTASDSLTVTDAGTPSPNTGISRKLTIGSNDINVIQAKIEVENYVAVYRDTSTGGKTGRVAGNFGANCEFDMYFDDFNSDNVPDPGSADTYKFYVTNTLFWQLQKMYTQVKLRNVPIEGDTDTRRAEMATQKVVCEWDSKTAGNNITTPGSVAIWS